MSGRGAEHGSCMYNSAALRFHLDSYGCEVSESEISSFKVEGLLLTISQLWTINSTTRTNYHGACIPSKGSHAECMQAKAKIIVASIRGSCCGRCNHLPAKAHPQLTCPVESISNTAPLPLNAPGRLRPICLKRTFICTLPEIQSGKAFVSG
jgi:hypothetical protein